MGRWMIADTPDVCRCLQFLELDNLGEQCEHALGMNLLIYWTLDLPCVPQPTYHLVLGTGELRRFPAGPCSV